MQNRIPKLWTFGGLSIPELLRRTIRESWRDEVFGQGGRMAFYQFLAIFPSLLVGFTIVTHLPHHSDHLKSSLRDLSAQLFPTRVSQLFQGMFTNFSARPRFGLRLLSVCAAAVWAAHNGTWAMIYGLNRAYEVEEHRSWWSLTVTIVVLTVGMAATASIALLFIFCSAYLQAHFHGGTVFLRALEWVTLSVSLSFSFVVLYRYAPCLRPHALRWSTPGALCALILWLASTFAAHIYFDHINDYAGSYGPLNGVVMLLLWLYASNGALLIGGEMNSEIQKAETGRADSSAAKGSAARAGQR
ncbi:MAG: rane protein [Acidobacteriaceae bacterium]|nr:rane protein [Acidobacteriaceae bacterium]MDX6460082.1 rane protein [Acidobacteriaceae bacterium]